MRFSLKLLLSAATVFFVFCPLHAQDLAPRGYLITPVHSNAITLSYSFFDGGLLFDGTVPITGATARVNVSILSFTHSLRFCGRSANVIASLPYGVGNFRGTVVEAEARAYEAKSKLARYMALWHARYDLLLAPVTPTAAPPVETLYNSDAFPRWTKGAPYTLPFNLTGQPAASMPAGLTAAGLPVGLQIVGPARGDALVLRAMRAYESASGWTWPQAKVVETLSRIGIA